MQPVVEGTGVDVMLFPTPDSDFPFDIFSATFYLLSRYEEYLPFEPDRFGRYTAAGSMAFRYGFLDIPVIHGWAMRLAEALRKKYPGISVKLPRPVFLPTIDIDTAWAVRNRETWRTVGGLVKSLGKDGMKAFRQRLSILAGKARDPFDTFDYIRKVHGGELTVFMLAGKGGRYDLNNPTGNAQWQQLVKTISAEFNIGVHPSFHSGDEKGLLTKEKKLISRLTGISPVKVRQHFLLLRFPDTYRRLIAEGFMEDYTMGYADQPGFRAGTSIPFSFYDLEREEETMLTVFPFVVMDRTLKDYLSLSPEDAMSVLKNLVHNVQKYGGYFIPVWHNDALGDQGEWKGWRNVYEAMLDLIKEMF